MRKIVQIADIHKGIYENNLNFLNETIQVFKDQIIPFIKEKKADTVVFLGDFFDNRSSINLNVMNSAVSVVKEISDIESVEEIIMLVGNHDVYYKTNNKVHSLNIFRAITKVRIVDEAIYTVKCKDKSLYFVPWLSGDVCDEFINLKTDLEKDICFGHFEIAGAVMTKSSVSGYEIEDKESKYQKTLVWNKFKKTYTGHYHLSRHYISDFNGADIFYIGSLCPHNIGDAEEKKGFVYLDIEIMEEEFIENNVSSKFKVLNFPEKINPEEIKGCYVDIIIDSQKIPIQKLNLYKTEAEKYTDKRIRIRFKDSSNILEQDSIKIDNIGIEEIYLNHIEENIIDFKEEIKELFKKNFKKF